MDPDILRLSEDLNHRDLQVRLGSLEKLMGKMAQGAIARPPRGNDVNNHIHTTYSFSPYSPTKAVWQAFTAGLATAGIMDHDSISGAAEFLAAGKIAGIATTIGVECRADLAQTPLAGRKINNPDQETIAYVALHGIPHNQIAKVRGFFQPYIRYRNIRNAAMVGKINAILASSGIGLSFEQDVVPLSRYSEGGSITERHILYALAMKLIAACGKGPALLHFLHEQLRLETGAKIANYLTDPDNPHYAYDLLGLLKSELAGSFYIPATSECPDVQQIVAFAREIGAIMAYAYLGDVTDSVTGDKRAQKFEDDYLDLLFTVLKDLQFNAVTYMPSRNSMAQLDRVRSLCRQYGFLQISGEDINSPRQSFICTALRDAKFQNLIDATWALIAHENIATADISRGIFSPASIASCPDLDERIKVYQELGRKLQGGPSPP